MFKQDGEVMSAEVSEMLDIPVYLVGQWIAAGKISAVKRMNRWYINRDSLKAFLKSENIPLPETLIN